MIGVITKEQKWVYILNSFVGYTSRREKIDDLFKMKSRNIYQRIKNDVCQSYPQKYNSISLILLLCVFHFGSHPLMNFSLHNHDWQDLFPGDCMSWPLLTLVPGPGCDALWLAEALLGRHSVSDTGPHQFCQCNFLILPWVTFGGLQVHRYCSGLGSFVEKLSFICVPSVSLSPYPL